MPKIEIEVSELVTYVQEIEVTKEELEQLETKVDSTVSEIDDNSLYLVIESKIDRKDVTSIGCEFELHSIEKQ